MPSPSEYQVIEGFLTSQNGEALMQLSEITPSTAGFVLCTPDQAMPWVQDGTTITADECAIILFGQPSISTKLPTTTLTIPCRDPSARTVMISCTMIQLGEKPVVPAKMDEHRITEDKAVLVALTLNREDWGSEWLQVTKNPAAWIRQVMGSDDLIALWGKSCRNGRQPTTPMDATSIQLHATVREDRIQAFLTRTGFNSIWATPKCPDGTLSQAWKLVWLPQTLDQAGIKVLSAKTPGATGLVQVNRKFALRVPKSQFEAARKAVYPDAPVPVTFDAPRTFKVEGLPFGTTASMLTAWMTHIKWQAKPIRALGPRGWIIGASDDAPEGHLSFNSMPILVRELNMKQAKQNPIVAGPKQRIANNVSAASSAMPPDPWASYTGPRLRPDPPRAATGPTETRLSSQEQRLQQLEESVTQIKALQATQGETMQQMQADTHNLEKNTKQYLDQGLQNLRKEIDTSFASALQAQANQFNSSINSSMAEFKQLLMAKRKTPEEGDADMHS